MDAKDNRVLSNWMTSYLKGERIVVYGDGRQTRTFCYASDGIAMCLAAMILGKDGEVYNVGNPAPELSIAELAEVFCKILNYENKYELIEYPTQYPSDEPARRCPNIDKILKLGVQYPQVDLSVGLNKMLDYFQGEES
jgi:UDP-glucuronate decarboxylase